MSSKTGLNQRQNDVFFGVELVVDRSLGHPNPVGDHLQRRSADTVLGEEFEGRLQHAFADRSARRCQLAHACPLLPSAAVRTPCLWLLILDAQGRLLA